MLLVAGVVTCIVTFAQDSPKTEEKAPFGPNELAVVVNADDPLSVKIGDYYQKSRRIPDENIIKINFTPGIRVMIERDFNDIKKIVDEHTLPRVQAYAITWAEPHRVQCMSITTAFAVGYDEAFCPSKVPCEATKWNVYFNSNSRRPFNDLKIRPTMAIAGLDFKAVKALIDRGVASDGTFPTGTGYLLSTSDKERNVRSAIYPAIMQRMRGLLKMRLLQADFIENQQDVLFYFTGLHDVPKIATNRYVPGAIADHLTSIGGRLTDSIQMSSLRWLEAGATGSYGSVKEPCNVLEKFPNPAIVIERYFSGESLIEAYWKSVAMPGQGIFIGEPLAAPFRLPSRKVQ